MGGLEFPQRRACDAGHLEFTLGGANLTAATPTLTQEVLERHVPCMLGSALFHSDASITSLLEASDGKFKDTLAALVDTTIWQERLPLTTLIQSPPPPSPAAA